MMFVSTYPVCSPALPVSYWAEAAAAASANPRVFEHSGQRRQHPLHDAFSANAVKRTSSFYISDILYPSVIPLPGTLPHSNCGSPRGDSPHSPPARQPCDSRGTTSLPSVTTTVASTPVKSSDLKFGIDRILADDTTSKDRLTDGGFDKKPLTKMSLAAPTPVISYCPCSAPSSTYGMVYAPLSYSSTHGTHPLVQIQHATHPAARTPTSPPGGYHQMARQSDFPGPYAALASETHPTQQQQPKRKRSWSRAVFSNLQRKGLEKRFEVQKYVTKPDRRQLAAMLGLTDAQVKVWFQNRRMKWRHAEDAKRKRDEEETCKRDSTDSEKENGTALDSPDSIMRMSDDQENENVDMVNGDIILQTSDSESDSEHEIMLDS